MTVTIALVAPGTGIHQAQSPSSGGFRDVQGLTEGGGADVPHLAAEVHDSTGRRPCLESGSVPREAGTGVQPAAEIKGQA